MRLVLALTLALLPAAAPAQDQTGQLRAQLESNFRFLGYRIGNLSSLDSHGLAELYLLTQNPPTIGSSDWLRLRNQIRTRLYANGYVCDPATTAAYFCRG